MKMAFQYRNGRLGYRQKRRYVPEASSTVTATDATLLFPAPPQQARGLAASSTQLGWDKAA
ncbi:hypothetical protein [Hymenobacter crusticola]|uniref:Uncharacterized protein n=1 Tax=Hymenobacter crusticola TaxID=1770526 RepID=A0A243W8S0_9BACT|nr:hypothetical protein [Hymenobacter crusticola]OUJ70577.1 hypothetical protein BXP70_23800 [Hymenobacter crusticola]